MHRCRARDSIFCPGGVVNFATTLCGAWVHRRDGQADPGQVVKCPMGLHDFVPSGSRYNCNKLNGHARRLCDASPSSNKQRKACPGGVLISDVSVAKKNCASGAKTSKPLEWQSGRFDLVETT